MNRSLMIRRLLGLLRPHTALVLASSAARVANQTLGVAIPAFGAAAVAAIATDSAVSVWSTVAMLALMALAKGSFRYLEQFAGHAVAFSLLADLRADLYRTIEPLVPAGLEDERSGDLAARVVGDVDRVEPFYAHTIAPLIGSVFVPLVAVIGLALVADPVVALVLAPFPLLMVALPPWLGARRVADWSARLRAEGGEAAAVLTDAVQGAREIAVLEAFDPMAERVAERSRAAGAIRGRLARVGALRSGLGNLLAGAAVLVTAVVAAARFAEGTLSLPALAASIVVAWAVSGPARAPEEIVPDLEQALAAAGRLFELSERTPPVDEPAQDIHHVSGGAVRLQGVSVALGDPGTAALTEVSVEVPEGALAAIVGPSGGGKSTLTDLLVRFRDPDSGSVLVGGTDVRRVPLRELRSAVSLVSQRPEVFFGTLADNLRLADPEADDGDLHRALERAALDEWARSLQRGLETPIGESGETLSGGQRQRLALARALLLDPRVLVLDEATSELDAETSARVLRTVEEERGRRTIIVVTHRLETVTEADLIVVLDRGRVVETGRHETLVGSAGVYAGLWRRHTDLIDG